MKIIPLILSLLFSTVGLAQQTEQINPADPNYNVELNAILQTINANNTTNQNNINTLQGYFTSNILATANGGTGQDSHLWLQGTIPYLSATGTWANLGTGTAGKALTTQGPSANPTWTTIVTPSNVLFQYSGQVDQQGASVGEFTGTTLNPNAQTGNYRFLQSNGNGFYVQIWSAKFIKIAGINTVTVKGRIWTRTNSGGGNANLQVSVGGQTGNASAGVNIFAPTWVSFTIDVSSLTNGTTYDVLASEQDIASMSQTTYCANIMGFGS